MPMLAQFNLTGKAEHEVSDFELLLINGDITIVFSVLSPDNISHEIFVYGKLHTKENGDYYWTISPTINPENETVLWIANSPIDLGKFNISYNKNINELFIISASFYVMLKPGYEFLSTKPLNIQTIIHCTPRQLLNPFIDIYQLDL